MDTSLNESLSRDSSPGLQEWDQEVAEVLAQGQRKFHRQGSQSATSTPTRSGSAQPGYSPFRPATVLSNAPRNNTATVTPTHSQVESLYQSAARGEVSKLREYLNSDSDPDIINDLDTRSGLTALMWAAAYDQPLSAKFLLECGADVDVVAPEERMGVTALHLAASAGSTAVMQLLLDKSRKSINTRTLDGCTPLVYAVYKNHLECVSILLRSGADLTIPTAKGYTPLHLATVLGYRDVDVIINTYLLRLMDQK